MDEDSVSGWIRGLKTGDAQAAQRLWERYYPRLVGLARKKLQDAPRRAQDEEDVVQDAFNSFCLRAQDGQFPDLHDRDGLWPLLVLMTNRKAANLLRHERRAKRGGGQPHAMDSHFGDTGLKFAQAIANEPSPEEAAIFFSELDRFMDSLEDPTSRVILLWKLEERTNEEIARHLDCSISTVERKMRFIRQLLTFALMED